MKTLIVTSILVVSVFCSIKANAQYTTLTVSPSNPTNSFAIVAGEGMDIIYESYVSTYFAWSIQTSSGTISSATGYQNTSPVGIKIGGPATLTFWMISTPGGGQPATAMLTVNKTSSGPNTYNVIPKGQVATITLQSTYDLGSGQWTPLFSQAFNNVTQTNQFFKFTMSTP